MKTSILKLVIILLLLIVGLGTAKGESLAQETSPVENDNVALDLFGITEETLNAPIDSIQFTFALPADWIVEDGATFRLHYTAQIDPLVAGQATLDVTMNDVPLKTIPIERSGEVLEDIEIPLEALVPSRSGARHRLSFAFNNNTDCVANANTQVIIHPDSNFTLPHTLGVPATDLTQLPYPLYQYSFVPNDTLIVVPDQPTPDELRAALSVAVGWGQRTDRNLQLNLLRANELESTLRTGNHLIFVGKPSTLPLITQVAWPSPPVGDSFDIQGLQSTDGIIQMAISPWDEAKSALLVSGQNDEALVKAAHALNTGQIQPYGRPDLALISQVETAAFVQQEVPTDRTLADLGYETTLVENSRRDNVSFDFQIPSESMVSDTAFFELVFAHSALIDYAQSRVTLLLNGDIIGSLRLSEESVNITHTSIDLPPMSLHPGVNELEVDMQLTPLTECSMIEDNGIWFTIYLDSLLHLPLQPIPEGIHPTFSLIDYPEPFDRDVTLSQTAVVLPQDDIVAWQTAVQLLLGISREVQLPLANPLVVYAEDVPEKVHQNYDLMVIGQPANLPILATLDASLPVGFEDNEMIMTDLPFVFRRPADTPLGYLQIFPSGSNNNHHALLISGNSEAGMQLAANALTTSGLHDQMNGNIAIVDGEQITVAYKQQIVPTATTEASDEAADDTFTTIPPEKPISDGRPGWLLPLLIISILAIIAVAAGVIITARRRQSLAGDITHDSP